MRKKNATLPPRAGLFNRFQTAVGGLGFVASANGARFDPYTEPVRQQRRSKADMEQVERIAIAEQ
ncbi:MAG: hypothetical protein ACRD0Y_08780 [Terriglobales bacterium]